MIASGSPRSVFTHRRIGIPISLAGVTIAALLVGGSTAEATPPGSVAPRTVGDGVLGSWSALGSSTNLRVNALLMKDDTLYVGGDFANAGGVSNTTYIAAWSTATESWHALGIGVDNSVWTITSQDDTVYAGGYFTSASGVASTVRAAAWSERDDTWMNIGSTPNDVVLTSALQGDDTLAVGGAFTTPTQWLSLVDLDTSSWVAPPAGLNNRLEALAGQGSYTAASDDDTLYVGGPFTTPSGGIAALAPGGASWSALGGGLNDEVRSIALAGQQTASTVDDTLYAGGYFTDAGGSASGDYIAAWSSVTNTWSALGAGLNTRPVLAIAVDDTRGLVYAGGDFTQVQGGETNSMSRVGVWDTGISEWIPLKFGLGSTANGVNSTVEALALDDSVVYVGGNFTDAGSAIGVSSITRVARWNWDAPEGTSSDDTAYPGDTITLTGQGLIGVTSVHIGDDTEATFTRDDSTTIQVTIPPGAFRDDTIYVDAVGGVGEFGTFTSWPTIPEPPLTPVAEAGDAAATVEWSQPASDGGSTIGTYTAVASPGGATCTTAATECTVSGLSNGVTYTFRVRATNPQGASDPSSASNAVTPVATPVVPQPSGAPGQVTATAGDASALVSWTAPTNAGSFPISTYQVTSSPGGKACLTSATSCRISGLTNGRSYTFTVKALTGAGWSAASEPSDAVTPTAPSPPSITIAGSRSGRTVEVTGTSTGIDAGTRLTPWIRVAPRASFAKGRARVVVTADGTFAWKRRSSRDLSVYFTGSGLRSNTVTVRGR